MKRRNPASGGTLGGAGNALARKRCNLRLDTQARQIEYLFGMLWRWKIALEDAEHEAHPTVYGSPEWERAYGERM